MDKINLFVRAHGNNTTLVRTFLLLFLIILFSFLASCSNTIMPEKQTALNVSHFAELLESGENEAVKNMLMSESDETVLVQYKAMLLEYISQQTELYVEAYQSDAADLDTLEENLMQLRGILDEISGLFDAVDYYDEMRRSEEYYALGLAYYNENQIHNAKESLMLVDESSKNYNGAMEILNEIQQYDEFWESRVGSGLYGKNDTGITEQDGCIYFPLTQNDITMIVKHDANQNETTAFPIIKIKGEYLINSINSVGDYLFFIAGENVGKGYVVENPYNIYRIKNDGTGLKLMATGDFFDLVCYEDTFYALSYTEGLVKFDRFFEEREIIKNEDIISVHPSSEGVYYVQRGENEFLSQDTLYFYDGFYSQEVFSRQNLRCYFYGDEIVSIYYGYSNAERFIITDDLFVTKKQYFCLDVREYFGKIDDVVFALTTDIRFKEFYMTYDLVRRVLPPEEVYSPPAYEILGVCEEIGKVLLKENDCIYFSDTLLEDRKEIVIPVPNENELSLNSSKLLTYDDWYTDNEYLYIVDDYWHYSDDTLYVTVEKNYSTRYDTSIYTAHIRTTGADKLTQGYIEEAPGHIRDYAVSIALKNKAVLAVNGDYWNEYNNEWIGIIIREGKVYKDELISDMVAFNNDGTIACYNIESRPITLEELQAADVQNTMSFGPALIIDGQYGNIDNHFLAGINPRTAIGMIEPNHFVVVCCDGRTELNRGLRLEQLADIFSQLGCSEAYNLDGGQSTSIIFMGEPLNDPSTYSDHGTLRTMPDILFIGQTELVQP